MDIIKSLQEKGLSLTDAVTVETEGQIDSQIVHFFRDMFELGSYKIATVNLYEANKPLRLILSPAIVTTHYKYIAQIATQDNDVLGHITFNGLHEIFTPPKLIPSQEVFFVDCTQPDEIVCIPLGNFQR
ncbi:MAG: hypothetical protein UT34_C0002G0115 [candidate division WS6 bacterium GW2011_GWF2_39_15]|uniref:Uncharacterized protein n=1 Tax=candidate division WS6 bacterium GW2011_GWF2_39_15 TaxID=1619100 RepID=A0A0G0MR60_9BACT|nr:MAG: hypothetical protein UT34_C0002G0115 [candidate division WS6 bacterium GW2011_GWF2_39_15]